MLPTKNTVSLLVSTLLSSGSVLKAFAKPSVVDCGEWEPAFANARLTMPG
jgi:hypothetical protein